MKPTKTIALIGLPKDRSATIAASLANSEHRLLLVSDQPETRQTLITTINNQRTGTEVDAVTCAKEASWEADIIILNAISEADSELAEKIREVTTGKIVVLASGTAHSKSIDTPDTRAAEKLQELLPYAKVVATYNNTSVVPVTTPDEPQADAFVAGNSTEAVNTVAGLLRRAGYNPIAIGDLNVSRMGSNAY